MEGDQIGFGRGEAGFAAWNLGDEDLDEVLATRLPPGTYCDVARGDFIDGGCSGPTATVEADGALAVELPPRSMLAIHVGSAVE